MNQLQSFLDLVSVYASQRGITESTASNYIFKDGAKIADLRTGRDIGVRRMAQAIQWLSDNWPIGVDWPPGIERPEPQVNMEAAE